jgi:hypothetical protein
MLDMQAQIEGLMNHVRSDMAPGREGVVPGREGVVPESGEALVRAASSQLVPLDLF